jgi:hypothetical protein
MKPGDLVEVSTAFGPAGTGIIINLSEVEYYAYDNFEVLFSNGTTLWDLKVLLGAKE